MERRNAFVLSEKLLVRNRELLSSLLAGPITIDSCMLHVINRIPLQLFTVDSLRLPHTLSVCLCLSIFPVSVGLRQSLFILSASICLPILSICYIGEHFTISSSLSLSTFSLQVLLRKSLIVPVCHSLSLHSSCSVCPHMCFCFQIEQTINEGNIEVPTN